MIASQALYITVTHFPRSSMLKAACRFVYQGTSIAVFKILKIFRMAVVWQRIS